MDFGCKVTGRVWIEIDGPVDYVYAADPEQMERIIANAGKPEFHYDGPPSYMRGKPRGHVEAGGDKPVMIEANLSALRLLRLKAAAPVTLRRCWVQFSPPHLPIAGAFESDDAELNRHWHMDVYTTLLCTQNNLDALVPVMGPGRGYVIWDGRGGTARSGPATFESRAWPGWGRMTILNQCATRSTCSGRAGTFSAMKAACSRAAVRPTRHSTAMCSGT